MRYPRRDPTPEASVAQRTGPSTWNRVLRLGARVRGCVESSYAMRTHQRYSSACGDAHVGAISYALLLAVFPALVVLAASTHYAARFVRWVAEQMGLSDWVDSFVSGLDATGATVARDTLGVLPVGSGDAKSTFAELGDATVGVAIFAALYVVPSLMRAIRTAVRSLHGQPVGWGDPVQDLLKDLSRTVLVGAALTGAVVVARSSKALTPMPFDSGLPALLASQLDAFLVATLVLTFLLRASALPDPRVPLRAYIRASAVTALTLCVLKLVAAEVTDGAGAARGDLYGALAVVISVLVVGNVVVRVALRSLAWQLTRHLPALPQLVVPVEDSASLKVAAVVVGAGPAAEDSLLALTRQSVVPELVVVVDDTTDIHADGLTDDDAVLPDAAGPQVMSFGGSFDDLVRFVGSAGCTHLLLTSTGAVPARRWVAVARGEFRAGADVVLGHARRGLGWGRWQWLPRRRGLWGRTGYARRAVFPASFGCSVDAALATMSSTDGRVEFRDSLDAAIASLVADAPRVRRVGRLAVAVPGEHARTPVQRQPSA